MTKEETRYWKKYIDMALETKLVNMTSDKIESLKARNFAETYMQGLEGQSELPQAVFRRFLETVDFASVSDAIETATAAAEAVARLREALGHAEEVLAGVVTTIDDFLVSLETLSGKIQQVEDSIPDLNAYNTGDVTNAIENMDENYYVHMTDLDTRELMVRMPEADEKDGEQRPTYAWKAKDNNIMLFTYSATPAVLDKVYYKSNGYEAGFVIEAPN